MASPRNICPTSQRQRDELQSSYGRSLESNRTDLSVNSRDVVVAETWLVLGKIGEGSFGQVFEVLDLNTKRHYAIKRESKTTNHPQLKFENVVYDVLAGGVGIPQCHWYGQFDGFDCIVMDLLGPNLSQVRENVSSMELGIAVDLACQMISIAEHVHNHGLLLRDVKPDNFLFPANCHLPDLEMVESVDDHGMPLITYQKSTCKQVFEEQWGDSHPRLYVVDFGLACYWRDPETGTPYPPGPKKHNQSKTGTARYASINVHRGKSHSRRDDMESIAYILLELLLDKLPWAGISAKNSRMGWDRMRQFKVDTVLEDLCAGLPEGVLKFVEYPRSLQYFDKPDYERMRHYLNECLPGGTYSNVVKSPFSRLALSIYNDNTTQQELETKKQHQQQKYLQQPIDSIYRKAPNYNGEHTDLFTMDDLANQLPMATVSEPKPPPSLHKLLKRRNKSNKVGWNTHKHDDRDYRKMVWTTEEKSAGDNLVKSCIDKQ